VQRASGQHDDLARVLAPDLVRAAVEGRLPRGIGVERLRDAPAEWSQQFEALGFESAIITDRVRNGRFWPPKPQNSRQPTGNLAVENPAAGNGIFWMQRREAKIGLGDRKVSQRRKERNDTNENPHRNGLFGVGAGFAVWVRTGGGGVRSRNANPSQRRFHTGNRGNPLFPLSLVKTGEFKSKGFRYPCVLSVGFRAMWRPATAREGLWALA